MPRSVSGVSSGSGCGDLYAERNRALWTSDLRPFTSPVGVLLTVKNAVVLPGWLSCWLARTPPRHRDFSMCDITVFQAISVTVSLSSRLRFRGRRLHD